MIEFIRLLHVNDCSNSCMDQLLARLQGLALLADCTRTIKCPSLFFPIWKDPTRDDSFGARPDLQNIGRPSRSRPRQCLPQGSAAQAIQRAGTVNTTCVYVVLLLPLFITVVLTEFGFTFSAVFLV